MPTKYSTIGFNRRGLLQRIGAGTLGLASAALLGCSGDTKSAPGKASEPANAATGVETLPLTAPVAQGTPKRGGKFAQGMGGSTYVQHDSHTQLGASEWHIISEKTIELHPVTGQLVPSVATSWEAPDPSGMTLVLKIKPGIKIHNIPPWNGREFNAEDVAWNLERIGGLHAERLKIPAASFQRATMVQNITKAVATDPYTVKVTLSSPNSGFFNGISENRTMLMPKEMDAVGYSDPMKFGGIGPWQMAEFTKDVRERFVRFDGYKSFRSEEPWFDEYTLLAIPDLSATLASFISGQIQQVGLSTQADLQTVQKGRPDSLSYAWIDSNWSHIRPNMSYEPFRDFRVRRAIFESIDYAKLGNGAFGAGWGYQAALNPGFPEAWKPGKVRSLPGFNPDTKTQDRADAAKLLAAAGYPNGKGLDIEILYWNLATISYLSENALRFQSQMTELYPEMKVTVRETDGGNYAAKQSSSDFKMVSYVITSTPDPVLELISQYRTGGSRNYGKFSNADLDGLLDKSLKELNRDARQELLGQFQSRFVNEWLPNFVLYANAARSVVAGNVGGYDKFAGTFHGYSDTTKVGRYFYVSK